MPSRGDFVQNACATYFEHMWRSVESDARMCQMAAEGAVPRECVRKMCEPFFEHMVTVVQEALEYQVQQPHQWTHGAYWPRQPAAVAPLCRFDDESTEAESPSAFPSLFSGTSSDADPFDAAERKSEISELVGDADKSIMVCRHWKSKGWCRLGCDCKFLHPESKRGISVPAEGTAPSAPHAPRRKRGGKNRAAKAPQEQRGSEGRSAAGPHS